MSKITLNDVVNLENETTAVGVINTNSAIIETAMDNTLSRDGTTPNQMEATLDMNSNRIINLPAPISADEPARLTDLNTLNGGGTIVIEQLPTGGTTGQLLTKNSSTNFDASWLNPVGILPTGGTSGQALLKNSSTNFDASFQTINQMTTGGLTGQVLTKNSNTNFDTSWATVSGSSARSQTYQIDLRDLLDARYGVNAWTQYSFNATTGAISGSDIAPAITDGLTTIRAGSGRGAIYIPPGTWRMNSGIPGNLLSGSYILGSGSQASHVIYCNGTGAAFAWTGAAGFTGGGMKGVSIFIGPELGNTTSIALLLQGDAQFQADQMMFEDLYVSLAGGRAGHPASYWFNTFEINASARTGSGPPINGVVPPQGSRVGNILNVQLFNAWSAGFVGINLVQWTITNLGVYTGQNAGGNSIIINGNSTHVYGMGLNGTLNISATSDTWLNGIRYS